MFQHIIARMPCRALVDGITSASLGKPDYALAFHVSAAVVHRLAQAAALGIFHELSAGFLAFQVDDFGLDGVELGLSLWRQGGHGCQQRTGFIHFGGAGFTDLMQLHVLLSWVCPCNRRAGCNSHRLLILRHI